MQVWGYDTFKEVERPRLHCSYRFFFVTLHVVWFVVVFCVCVLNFIKQWDNRSFALANARLCLQALCRSSHFYFAWFRPSLLKCSGHFLLYFVPWRRSWWVIYVTGPFSSSFSRWACLAGAMVWYSPVWLLKFTGVGISSVWLHYLLLFVV